MLRLASYDIVFQEIPGEVTLALNISGCPNGCPGCHSPHLQEDTGQVLDQYLLDILLTDYGSAVTCVCFMGGDAVPEETAHLAGLIRKRPGNSLKTAWYSGRRELYPAELTDNFDYIKTGPYIELLGGLTSPDTNQRFYRNVNGQLEDITHIFHKK